MMIKTRPLDFRTRARFAVAQAYNKVVAELNRKSAQFAHAPIGMHTLSPKGIILEANQKWLDVMGYEAGEVVGHSIFDFIKPEQRENAQARFEARLAGTDLPPKQEERIYITKSGREVEIVTHDTVYHEHGRVTEVQTSFVDVTEVNILRRAAKVTEIQASLGRMLAEILHRLKNDVQAIKATAEVLSQIVSSLASAVETIGTERAPSLAEWAVICDLVRKCGGHATTLEESVVDMEQEIRSSLGSARTEVDARAALLKEAQYIINKITARAQRAGVDLSLAPNSLDENVWVGMSVGELRSILENIIGNAFDAFPPEHVGGKRVAVELVKEGGRVRVSVTDNGCGIPENLVKDLYKLLVNTTKREMGTGLGCFHVGQSVNKAGGEIVVSSQLGLGTAITVFLPIVEAPQTVQAVVEVAPIQDTLSPSQITVWFVDDTKNIKEMLMEYFKIKGFNVMGFDNGQSLLDALAVSTKIPDVIITDMNMPGMTGIELIEKIKERVSDCPVRFLLATGEEVERVTSMAEALSVEVLVKPFVLSKLVKRVEDLFNGS